MKEIAYIPKISFSTSSHLLEIYVLSYYNATMKTLLISLLINVLFLNRQCMKQAIRHYFYKENDFKLYFTVVWTTLKLFQFFWSILNNIFPYQIHTRFQKTVAIKKRVLFTHFLPVMILTAAKLSTCAKFLSRGSIFWTKIVFEFQASQLKKEHLTHRLNLPPPMRPCISEAAMNITKLYSQCSMNIKQPNTKIFCITSFDQVSHIHLYLDHGNITISVGY